MTPEERRIRAKIAALERVCRPDYDGRAATEPARRAAFENRCREVDPDNRLSDAERSRKARNRQSLLMYRGRLERLRSRKGVAQDA